MHTAGLLHVLTLYVYGGLIRHARGGQTQTAVDSMPARMPTLARIPWAAANQRNQGRIAWWWAAKTRVGSSGEPRRTALWAQPGLQKPNCITHSNREMGKPPPRFVVGAMAGPLPASDSTMLLQTRRPWQYQAGDIRHEPLVQQCPSFEEQPKFDGCLEDGVPDEKNTGP